MMEPTNHELQIHLITNNQTQLRIGLLSLIILFCLINLTGCSRVYYDGFRPAQESLDKGDQYAHIRFSGWGIEAHCWNVPSDSMMNISVSIYAKEDSLCSDERFMNSLKIKSFAVDRYDGEGYIWLKLKEEDYVHPPLLPFDWCYKHFSYGNMFFPSSVDSMAIRLTASYELENGNQYQEVANVIQHRRVGSNLVPHGSWHK